MVKKRLRKQGIKFRFLAVRALCFITVISSLNCFAQNSINYKKLIPELAAPYVNRNDFSGVILIADSKNILYTQAFGYADLAFNIPVTTKSKFRIASITKTFTASAILRLQEKGKLSVSDHLNKYYPSFPKADSITIEQLLTHSSGVPEIDMSVTDNKYYSIDDVIDLFRNKPFLFEPGTNQSYSSTGYVLLAKVVEIVSGHSYQDFLKNDFLNPFSMNQTGILNQKSIVPGLVSPYVPGNAYASLQRPPWQNMDLYTGSGCLYSSAEDIYKWTKAIIKNDKTEISKASFPYGWSRGSIGNSSYIGQTGGIPGVVSDITYFRNKDIYIICISNIGSAAFFEIRNELRNIVLGKPVDEPTTYSKYEIRYPDRNSFSGNYKLDNGNIMQIKNEDGNFYYKWLNIPSYSAPLTPIGENSFFSRWDYAFIKFNSDGALNWIQNGTKTLGTKTLGTKTLGAKTLGAKTLGAKTLGAKASK